jgi:hypothetical protein
MAMHSAHGINPSMTKLGSTFVMRPKADAAIIAMRKVIA